MTPGETALTRTPCGAASFASDFVNVMSPPLDVEYGPAPGPPPLRPAIDTTLMIAAFVGAIITGNAAREQNAALFKLRSMISSQSSSVRSTIGCRFTREPALL